MNRGAEPEQVSHNNNVTTFKIYETLESVAESPSVPDRPAWTLQVPDQAVKDASPLYLPIEPGVKVLTSQHYNFLTNHTVGRDSLR